MLDIVDRGEAGKFWTGIYEPGNGTRYTAVGVFLPGGLDSMGMLGTANGEGRGCWLVTLGNTGRAYALQPDGSKFLHPDYVAKKFDLTSGEDARHATALIASMIGRPGPEIERKKV